MGKVYCVYTKKKLQENEELRRTQITKTKQKNINKPKLIIPHNSKEKTITRLYINNFRIIQSQNLMKK